MLFQEEGIKCPRCGYSEFFTDDEDYLDEDERDLTCKGCGNHYFLEDLKPAIDDNLGWDDFTEDFKKA